MNCYPCPKQDRAESLAADSRRQVDAAWVRLRHVYLAAHDAGLDIGEESLRAHFLESYVDNEYASRVSDALAAFHSWTVTNLHMLTAAIEDGKLDRGDAWDTFTGAWRRKWPRHPASGVSMTDCRDSVNAKLAKASADCPPPDDPLDPYGTPPLLGVAWSEQQSGCRVARDA